MMTVWRQSRAESLKSCCPGRPRLERRAGKQVTRRTSPLRPSALTMTAARTWQARETTWERRSLIWDE